MESNLTPLHSKYLVLCTIPLTYQLDLKAENLKEAINSACVQRNEIILYNFCKLKDSTLSQNVKFQAKQANGVKIDF
ncbi:hypothetical protein T02_16527 [Trichinella nativa]|uniref:Uncharacterized protein n=1 Tax=Trichinella nativa TaxID=6335 RepID=A0A0V1KSV9_9BILA|nr:hypothetical protein T02_16527 [Trichinella nativa]